MQKPPQLNSSGGFDNRDGSGAGLVEFRHVVAVELQCCGTDEAFQLFEGGGAGNRCRDALALDDPRDRNFGLLGIVLGRYLIQRCENASNRAG